MNLASSLPHMIRISIKIIFAFKKTEKIHIYIVILLNCTNERRLKVATGSYTLP